MENEEDSWTNTWQKYAEWVKKNGFTVIGIIIILLVVWWNAATIDSQKKDLIDRCNAHWKSEVQKACPSVLTVGKPFVEINKTIFANASY